MVGEASWFTLLVFLVGFALIAAMVIGSHRLATRYRSLRAHRACPRSGAEADLIVRLDTQSGRFSAVERCDQLPNPDAITCDQACIHRRPAARPAA